MTDPHSPSDQEQALELKGEQDPPGQTEVRPVRAVSPESHRRLRASLENMRRALETGPQDSPESRILQEMMVEMEAILRRRSGDQE